MTPANFHEKLTAVLRDVARGTTADLADKMVAFWNGERVVYCFLRDNGSPKEFDLGCIWNERKHQFEAWMEQPVFSVRSHVNDWHEAQPPLANQ